MSSPFHTDVGNRIQKFAPLADCSKTEKGPQAQGLGTLFLIMVGDTGIEPQPPACQARVTQKVQPA